MKTPMQLMIEDMDNSIAYTKERMMQDGVDKSKCKDLIRLFKDIKKKATELLETEKQQIIEAYNASMSAPNYYTAEDYYNEKFNQKK